MRASLGAVGLALLAVVCCAALPLLVAASISVAALGNCTRRAPQRRAWDRAADRSRRRLGSEEGAGAALPRLADDPHRRRRRRPARRRAKRLRPFMPRLHDPAWDYRTAGRTVGERG